MALVDAKVRCFPKLGSPSALGLIRRRGGWRTWLAGACICACASQKSR